MARPKKSSSKPRKPFRTKFTDKQTAHLVRFFLDLLFEAKIGILIEPVGSTDEDGNIRFTGGGRLEQPKAKKRILKILEAINKERVLGSKEFNAADVGYYRLAAIDALAAIYEKQTAPEMVSADQLALFLRNFLAIVPDDNPTKIREAIACLQRGKAALRKNSTHLEVEQADKNEGFNEVINKAGLPELAAINIEDALQQFPHNRLTDLKVGRSNYYKLRKSNPYGKIDAHLFSDNSHEICEFLLKDVFNFPASAREAALKILWEARNDELLTPRGP